MMIETPVLPYNFADLEPVLSRDTLMFHFLRHQRLCYDRLQALIRGTELAELALEQMIRRTERNPAEHDVFPRAAEAAPTVRLPTTSGAASVPSRASRASFARPPTITSAAAGSG